MKHYRKLKFSNFMYLFTYLHIYVVRIFSLCYDKTIVTIVRYSKKRIIYSFRYDHNIYFISEFFCCFQDSYQILIYHHYKSYTSIKIRLHRLYKCIVKIKMTNSVITPIKFGNTFCLLEYLYYVSYLKYGKKKVFYMILIFTIVIILRNKYIIYILYILTY